MDYPFSASILEEAEALLLCTLVNFEGKENLCCSAKIQVRSKGACEPKRSGKRVLRIRCPREGIV